MNDIRNPGWLAIARCGAACALAIAAHAPLAAQQPTDNVLRRAAQPAQPIAAQQIAAQPAQPQPAQAQPALPLASPPPAAASAESTWKLQTLSPAEYEGRLFAIWGHRAQATQDLSLIHI